MAGLVIASRISFFGAVRIMTKMLGFIEKLDGEGSEKLQIIEEIIRRIEGKIDAMEFAKIDSRVKVGFVCLKSFLKEGDTRHFDDYFKEIYGSLLEFKDYWSKHEGDIPTLNAFSMILTQVKFYQKSLENLSSTRIVP